LFDDRDLRAGEKFAEADLIGIPMRIVVSDKTVAEGKYEVKKRSEGGAKLVTENELFDLLNDRKEKVPNIHV
jgi:prolyl-tRNA synthetase